MVGDENRSADGIAEIVFLVLGFGLRDVNALIPRARIEDFIAQVFESAAVEGSATGLGFDFNSAGAVAAVLRAVIGS